MNKTYAIADLHGRKDLWHEFALELDENDKVYVLGDAIDRGPDGIELLQILMKDPRVTFLKGNHEEMLYNSIEEQHYNNSPWWEPQPLEQTAFYQWVCNGGDITYEQFMALDADKRCKILNYISDAPSYAVYDNKNQQQILLSHSGASLKEFRKIVFNRCSIREQSNILLWNREHFKQNEKINDNIYIVHGHTPIDFMLPHAGKASERILRYNNGHKINLDIGAVWINKLAVLDLDTLEEFYVTLM